MAVVLGSHRFPLVLGTDCSIVEQLAIEIDSDNEGSKDTALRKASPQQGHAVVQVVCFPMSN
jgi:hypothetical protein